ncbi:hypothetical protein DMP14_31390 [Pseudonocardia sp. Ae707_Ps2]
MDGVLLAWSELRIELNQFRGTVVPEQDNGTLMQPIDRGGLHLSEKTDRNRKEFTDPAEVVFARIFTAFTSEELLHVDGGDVSAVCVDPAGDICGRIGALGGSDDSGE